MRQCDKFTAAASQQRSNVKSPARSQRSCRSQRRNRSMSFVHRLSFDVPAMSVLPQVERPLYRIREWETENLAGRHQGENVTGWWGRLGLAENWGDSVAGNLGRHSRRWLQFFGMIHDRTMPVSFSSSTRDLTHTNRVWHKWHWEKSWGASYRDFLERV